MKVESSASLDAASFYRREAKRLREMAKLFVYEQTQVEMLGMAERYEMLAMHAAARDAELAVGELSAAY